MEAAEHHPGLPQHLTKEVHVPHDHDGDKYTWWERFRGHAYGRKPIGVLASLKAIAKNSFLNVFLIFIPIAWASHFTHQNQIITFAFCFLSTIPLEHLFDFGGEQMALYCGKDLGDLIVVTLNNAVEATLAIILLLKCELKLLQSTIAGVVLLHLLFIPGVAFLTGGARIWQQNLHPHPTQLNHTLLTIGVLALLVPAAFFSALNPGVAANNAATAALLAASFAGSINGTENTAGAEPFLSDSLRADFLSISRGISVILLVVYVCSRIFLYNPPGDDNALKPTPDAPAAVLQREHELRHELPEVGPWVCLGMLVVTIAIMATTAEFLVESIEFVRERSKITEEWFGVILLPLVSFSGDATVAASFFIKTALFWHPKAPESLAKGRAIDLSIQFTLFWMPFLVLLGWWTNKPLTLLFDLFEVALMIGACFLVNYVTADSKTNWAEGVILVAFYLMIALVAWFYDGQIEIHELLNCPGSVAEAVEGVVLHGPAALTE